MSEILSVISLTKHFKTPKGIVHAVDDITFSVKEGRTLGLVGESGSGKSTTGHVIAGIYPPTRGKVIFNGVDISTDARRRPLFIKKQIGMVFQDPSTSLNPKQTIEEILSLPLKVHMKITRYEELRKATKELLEKVQLPSDYVSRYPRDLGGGERQLVAIARALASEPRLIILDEPTSALDVSVQAKIITTLMKLQKEMGLTYIFITHDLSLMRNVADEVAIMYLGKIYELSETREFFERPLHPYTMMLISSIPTLSEEEEKLKPPGIESKGEIPSAVDPPKGCRFNTRCPFASEKCREIEPEFEAVNGSRKVACHYWREIAGKLRNHGGGHRSG
ncbi:MAG: ABC transporter ATP-binding protein [Fervidicoccaceae archaeon]